MPRHIGPNLNRTEPYCDRICYVHKPVPPVIGLLGQWQTRTEVKSNNTGELRPFQAKQKYRGVCEIQKSGDKTSAGEIGLDIRKHASPKVWRDQVSDTRTITDYNTFYIMRLNVNKA